MKKGHWIGVAVILIIGYIIGVKFPNIGQTLKGKISGAVSGA